MALLTEFGCLFLNNVEAYCKLAHLLPEHESEFGRGYIAAVKTAISRQPSSSALNASESASSKACRSLW